MCWRKREHEVSCIVTVYLFKLIITSLVYIAYICLYIYIYNSRASCWLSPRAMSHSMLVPKHLAAFLAYIYIEAPFFFYRPLDKKSTVQSCHGSTHHCAPPTHTSLFSLVLLLSILPSILIGRLYVSILCGNHLHHHHVYPSWARAQSGMGPTH